MHGVPAKGRVILLDLEFLGFELFVASGGISGRGFSLLTRFGALDGYDLAWHAIPFPWVSLRLPLLLRALRSYRRRPQCLVRPGAAGAKRLRARVEPALAQ